MIPGLEERLMNGDDTEAVEVAEHVRRIRLFMHASEADLFSSFKRGCPPLEPMTRRA